ncbi:Zn-dependent hydrolase [Vibrio litoralis]|uniref:Zn-dependent hydrolase n=1 Tax=Vibrio litoralis TaxID=335972 RepID=UPI0018686E74|nr:Zn-dependent hydrolase [Vibrio litoralis]
MEMKQYNELASQLFEAIYHLSFDGVGVSRASFSEKETEIGKYLQRFAANEGIATYIDAGANFVFHLNDTDNRKAVWLGSHLDSVPQGGNFDGLAGVIAGLLILVICKRENIHLPVPLKVIGLRGEESAWFGKAYMGSSALFGLLSHDDLQLVNRASGKTLSESFRDVGADISSISQRQPLVNKALIQAWLEVHIEQGPLLVREEKPVGIVSGIRGNIRHNKVDCFGSAQHSGAVPRELRHDAVCSVSELVVQLDHDWEEYLKNGHDLVVTSGIFQTLPEEHATTRISGHVNFSLEARSCDVKTLDSFYQSIVEKCHQIEQERGVKFIFDRCLTSPPALMNKSIINKLSESCLKQSIPYIEMASGAGHDSAIFSTQGIPSGMVFIRNRNGSHNPNEEMEIDDFLQAVDVILFMLKDWQYDG